MWMPQEYEVVAQERLLDWEKELQQRQLLAEVPKEPARWRRWTGNMMVSSGTWLMCAGERLVRRECQESVTAIG